MESVFLGTSKDIWGKMLPSLLWRIGCVARCHRFAIDLPGFLTIFEMTCRCVFQPDAGDTITVRINASKQHADVLMWHIVLWQTTVHSQLK